MLSKNQPKLDSAISGVLAELDTEERSKKSNGRVRAILGPVRGRPPDWTEEEDRIIREWLPHLGYAAVGEMLGRSANAVKIRSVRVARGQSPSRNGIYYTGNKIAEALNHDIHQVMAWHRRGLIKLERAPVKERLIMHIRRDDLLAWAVNPMNWPYFLYTESFRIRKIRDPKIARMVEMRRRRWGDEWLSIGEVAKLLGVHSHDVNRVFIKQGKYRGRKVKWHNWMFVRSDVLDARISFLRGKGQGHESLKWTSAAYDFMLLSLAVGIGNVPTQTMMGNVVTFEAQTKLRSMQADKKLRPLARQLGIEVRRRNGEIRLFADWRMYKHRFPSIARAAGKFLAGRKLGRSEKLLVRRQLFLWGWFFARTNLQMRFAERFKYAGARLTLRTMREFYDQLRAWGIDPFAISKQEGKEVVTNADSLRNSGRAQARRRRR